MRAPEFWNGHDNTARLAVAALTPFGWAYGATVAYRASHTTPYRSRAKVICVGNLSAGGTGKTPVSIAIARALAERGYRQAILTRGYGGRERGPLVVNSERDQAARIGDEALVLAAAAPVVVSRDRAAGAKLAEREGIDAIVMDDGHQNFALTKDLSIVVVDAAIGFGNGHVLPAGPLREPVEAGLARADAMVVVGDGRFVPKLDKPVLRARLVPVDVVGLSGRAVIAFAGIGRPEKFFETLEKLGAQMAETRAFPDHHVYTAAEIARLKASARSKDALIMTTEKDFVRLTPAERQDMRYLPVRAAFDDPAVLAALLDTVAPTR